MKKRGTLYFKKHLSQGGNVDDRKLYDLLVSRGIPLPEWWIVWAYKEHVKLWNKDTDWFLNFYLNYPDSTDPESLPERLKKYFEEYKALSEFSVIAIQVLSDRSNRDRSIIIRRSYGESSNRIGETFHLSGSSILGLTSRFLSKVSGGYRRMQYESDLLKSMEPIRDPLDIGIEELALTDRPYNALHRFLEEPQTIGTVLKRCDFHITDVKDMVKRLDVKYLGVGSGEILSQALRDFCNKHDISYK